MSVFIFLVKIESQNKEIGILTFVSLSKTNEPHREKTGFLPRRKQRRRSASR